MMRGFKLFSSDKSMTVFLAVRDCGGRQSSSRGGLSYSVGDMRSSFFGLSGMFWTRFSSSSYASGESVMCSSH
jgi:hypothetical protein